MNILGKSKVPPWAKAMGTSEQVANPNPPKAVSNDPSTVASAFMSVDQGIRSNESNLEEKAEKIR